MSINSFKKIKNKLYVFRRGVINIFKYPKMVTGGTVDYDAYWKDKRGDKIGSLSDWQILRAEMAKEIILSNKIVDEKEIVLSDIGCGDGNILNYLKNKIEDLEIKMVGVDISEFALKKAEEFGVQTIKEDITNKDFISKFPEADYTIMFEILEHIPHSEEFLKNAYKVSKKGVMFSFPNTGYVTHRTRLLFGSFPLQWRLSPGEHLRYWTLRDLKWWLKEQDYKNYEIKTYKGIPILNKIFPSLFAAAFFVFIRK